MATVFKKGDKVLAAPNNIEGVVTAVQGQDPQGNWWYTVRFETGEKSVLGLMLTPVPSTPWAGIIIGGAFLGLGIVALIKRRK